MAQLNSLLKQAADSIRRLFNKIKNGWGKIILPLIGAGSLIWFLIRVIPKPSRASYPCMKVAAPMASSFVLWILGLIASVTAFKKMKTAFAKSSYTLAVMFLVLGISFTLFTASQSGITLFAGSQQIETVIPNNPIGAAKGVNPGRVVWVWNPHATNENCTNLYIPKSSPWAWNEVADSNSDGYFLDKNNDQGEIDKMLSSAIKSLTDAETDFNAWDMMFKYFNNQRHGLDRGYQIGEKIFIKINANSGWSGNVINNEKAKNNYYALAETSPQLILSLLRQLVNVYGVAQEDISIGDPMKYIYNHNYNKWYAEFPNIHYIDNAGTTGREKAQPTATDVIKYSDHGSVLNTTGDKIYTVMNDADYLINVPTLKAHARAGITVFAKNHFGSHTRSSADHLHPGLVAPNEGPATRTESGMYRVQVDLMGHEKLGGNTVFFLLDALFAGSEAVQPPTKWAMAPFNNDWTSSIFLSQDMVAIESVAWDFLSTEYDGSREIETVWGNIPTYITVNFPNMQGTTDYLRQAADPSYWPTGFTYDPEGDGTPLTSLGVNEHWNNPTDKQYSRNLGTGNGIELIQIDQSTTDIEKTDENNIPTGYVLHQNYPNPFNPSTNISFTLNEAATVSLEVYDVLGKHVKTLTDGRMNSGTHKVEWNATNHTNKKVTSGIYICRLTVMNGNNKVVQSIKMNLLK